MAKSRQALWQELGIPVAYARQRGMPLHREARKLVSIGRADDDGKPLRLAPQAAQAWKEMRAAAARDGVHLWQVSAFRSISRQALIIRRKLRAGESIEQILRLVAAPGCSEHHTGRAIDIASPDEARLEKSFARTGEFRWLRRNAATFGFRLSYPRRNPQGIDYEPWHWCWHPPDPPKRPPAV